MGSVYLAEQHEPIERIVALKLMRSTLAGPASVARFGAERQAGIIHCDLKPSNVLVADVEGRPLPKIIDFGSEK